MIKRVKFIGVCVRDQDRVEFPNPPQDQAWGRFAIFKDSEGNSFVLSSAK